MYTLSTSKQFEKDYKLCKKRGLNLDAMHAVFELLKENGALPEKYKLHKLSGTYAGFIECHIKGDWLLIWDQDDELKTIALTRTGTHSDLFK